MSTLRITFASLLLLAAMLLTACQGIPSNFVQPISQSSQAANAEAMIYIATGNTILAYEVGSGGNLTLADSVFSPTTNVTKLRASKNGRVLFFGSNWPDYGLFAVRLSPDGKFAGAATRLLDGVGDRFEFSASGEFLFTLTGEAYPCTPADLVDGGYCRYNYDVVSSYVIAEDLTTRLAGQKRFLECGWSLCQSGTSIYGNWQQGGKDFLWLTSSGRSGSQGGSTNIFALSIDPGTGQLGSDERTFPYGIPVDGYVVGMPWNTYSNWIEGHAFDRWPGSEPLWKCVAHTYDPNPAHEGCSGKIIIDSKLPFLFSAAYYSKTLWSFPFSATQGPNVAKGIRAEFNLRPRQWFVVPESRLLVGFGEPRYPQVGPVEVFVFRINPQTGALSRVPEPPGGFPDGVTAITYRPSSD